MRSLVFFVIKNTVPGATIEGCTSRKPVCDEAFRSRTVHDEIKGIAGLFKATNDAARQ